MRLTAMSMGAASTLHVQTNLTVDLDSGLPKRGNQHLALDPPWAPLSRLFFQQPSVPWDIHESEPRLAAKRGICKCSSAAIPGGNEPPERKPGGQMSARGAFNSKRSEQQYNQRSWSYRSWSYALVLWWVPYMIIPSKGARASCNF